MNGDDLLLTPRNVAVMVVDAVRRLPRHDQQTIALNAATRAVDAWEAALPDSPQPRRILKAAQLRRRMTTDELIAALEEGPGPMAAPDDILTKFTDILFGVKSLWYRTYQNESHPRHVTQLMFQLTIYGDDQTVQWADIAAHFTDDLTAQALFVEQAPEWPRSCEDLVAFVERAVTVGAAR